MMQNIGPIPSNAARILGVERRYLSGNIEIPAVNGVDLSIPSGRFTVIGGPSGSGKSTLLHLLGCLDRPDAGTIEIAGQDVGMLDDDERSAFRARHIGFVFQSFNLLPVLTALENVEYPLRLLLVSPQERRRQAEGALAAVGLGGLGRRMPAELSGGQRQRVAIARALVKKPSLVLADEPTANLDQRTGAEVIALMRSMQQATGSSFVFCSHDPQLMGNADVKISMVDGRIVSYEECVEGAI